MKEIQKILDFSCLTPFFVRLRMKKKRKKSIM